MGNSSKGSEWNGWSLLNKSALLKRKLYTLRFCRSSCRIDRFVLLHIQDKIKAAVHIVFAGVFCGRPNSGRETKTVGHDDSHASSVLTIAFSATPAVKETVQLLLYSMATQKEMGDQPLVF